jgi:hypothetical protein
VKKVITLDNNIFNVTKQTYGIEKSFNIEITSGAVFITVIEPNKVVVSNIEISDLYLLRDFINSVLEAT